MGREESMRDISVSVLGVLGILGVEIEGKY